MRILLKADKEGHIVQAPGEYIYVKASEGTFDLRLLYDGETSGTKEPGSIVHPMTQRSQVGPVKFAGFILDNTSGADIWIEIVVTDYFYGRNQFGGDVTVTGGTGTVDGLPAGEAPDTPLHVSDAETRQSGFIQALPEHPVASTERTGIFIAPHATKDIYIPQFSLNGTDGTFVGFFRASEADIDGDDVVWDAANARSLDMSEANSVVQTRYTTAKGSAASPLLWSDATAEWFRSPTASQAETVGTDPPIFIPAGSSHGVVIWWGDEGATTESKIVPFVAGWVR